MREDEYSHKGIDRSVQVNKKYLQGNEYRCKFDKATDNPAVNKTLYEAAKEILTDRSGTRYETMYWINGDNGHILLKFDQMGKDKRFLGTEFELKVKYSERTLRRIADYKNIVVIHNHPNSTAPSAGDINSAFIHRYSLGFTVSHDGRVYKYCANELIDVLLFEQYVGAYVLQNPNTDIIEAMLTAYRKIAANSDINVSEVL